MRYFYLNGVWRGIDMNDVCASLTHYDSDFWHRNRLDCSLVIDRVVHSYETYLLVPLYFIFLVYLCVRCLSTASRFCSSHWRSLRNTSAVDEL